MRCGDGLGWVRESCWDRQRQRQKTKTKTKDKRQKTKDKRQKTMTKTKDKRQSQKTKPKTKDKDKAKHLVQGVIVFFHEPPDGIGDGTGIVVDDEVVAFERKYRYERKERQIYTPVRRKEIIPGQKERKSISGTRFSHLSKRGLA